MNGKSWQRLSGLVRQELYITRRRLEMIVDTVFFPVINVVLFGYIMHFIGNSGGEVNGQFFIVGILLWQILVVMQYNITVTTMWSIWSHNLTNIFITPIAVREYLIAQVIAATMRTAVIGLCLVLAAWFIFDFNLFSLGLGNLALFLLSLLIFGSGLGIAFMGVIFRFGVRLQAISWGAIYLIQPITGAFFPVSVLPDFLQIIAYALPPTYVFEAARGALTDTAIHWRYALIALALSVLYLIVGIVIFRYCLRRSKESGQFARNDL